MLYTVVVGCFGQWIYIAVLIKVDASGTTGALMKQYVLWAWESLKRPVKLNGNTLYHIS